MEIQAISLSLCAGPDVSLFLPAFLRDRGQDRQDRAAELSTGLQTSPSQTVDSRPLQLHTRVLDYIYKGCANLVHSSIFTEDTQTW